MTTGVVGRTKTSVALNIAAAVGFVVAKTTQMRAWTKRSVALVVPTVAAIKATVVDAMVHVVLVATWVVLAASTDADSMLMPVQRTSSNYFGLAFFVPHFLSRPFVELPYLAITSTMVFVYY